MSLRHHRDRSGTPTRAAVLGVGLLLAAPALAQMTGASRTTGASAGQTGGATGSSDMSSMSGSGGGGLTGGTGAASGGGAMSSMSTSSGPTALFGLKPASGAPELITLNRAIELASERNYDLRIATEQIVQAQTVVRRAWSAVLPRVNLGGNYVYTYPEITFSLMDQETVDGQKMQLTNQALMMRSLGQMMATINPEQSDALLRGASQLEDAANELVPMDPIAIQPAHTFTANGTIAVPVFNGRTIPLIMNSYDLVSQARYSIDRARQQALYGVASLYYGAVTLKKVSAIADANARAAETHRGATEARVAAGALPSIALKRAEYDLVQAQQTLRSARSSYAMVLGTLGQMIGVDTMFEVEAPAEVVAVEAQGNADQFYSRALESRRDIKALRVALNMAERGNLDYWMRFMPSLNLAGQANWTSNTNGFQTDPWTYNIVLQLGIPLYDGGERYAARDETASKIRQARLSIDKVEEQTAGLIRGNLDDISVKLDGLKQSELAVELAKENQRNAEALFDVGAATNIEVIDANNAAFSAEIALVRDELALRLARLGLLFIVGEYPALEDGKQISPFVATVETAAGASTPTIAPDPAVPRLPAAAPASAPATP
ncbi:MAG: TolC family protein [Deltaproteobacteria bacterium]|nr:TolC family protein [Deltaproteobacteria bacterium]